MLKTTESCKGRRKGELNKFCLLITCICYRIQSLLFNVWKKPEVTHKYSFRSFYILLTMKKNTITQTMQNNEKTREREKQFDSSNKYQQAKLVQLGSQGQKGYITKTKQTVSKKLGRTWRIRKDQGILVTKGT